MTDDQPVVPDDEPPDDTSGGPLSSGAGEGSGQDAGGEAGGEPPGQTVAPDVDVPGGADDA